MMRIGTVLSDNGMEQAMRDDFFGALGELAQEAMPIAVQAVSSKTGESQEAVEKFLRTRWGYLFGKDMAAAFYGRGKDLKFAADVATHSWLGHAFIAADFPERHFKHEPHSLLVALVKMFADS